MKKEMLSKLMIEHNEVKTQLLHLQLQIITSFLWNKRNSSKTRRYRDQMNFRQYNLLVKNYNIIKVERLKSKLK